MRISHIAAAGGLAWLGLTGAAGALTVTLTPGPQDPQYFASTPVGLSDFTVGTTIWAGSGATETGTVANQYTAPLGMGNTTYMAVQPGGTETATWATPQTSLTIYWGSIEDGNSLAITVDGFTLSGEDLVAFGADDSGSATNPNGNELVTIAGLSPFTTTTFSSTESTFEFSLGSGAVAAVPEPSTWSLMLMGSAGLGLTRLPRCRARWAKAQTPA
jgi:hypothetical protein